ncbi:MAG: hypothetical protein GX115_02510 [Ruminiclostridium sp.]|nr:hypothetical protein [Ruminiclostridium sp.]
MSKRLIPILLVVAMLFSVFTACGKKKTPKDEISTAREQIEDLPVQLDDKTEALLDKAENIDTGNVPTLAPANIKVTVDLPEGWEEDKDSTNVVVAYIKDTNIFNLMQSYAYSEVNYAKDLAKLEMEQIKEYFEEAAYSELEAVTVAGLEGCKFSMELAITESMKQTQMYVYFEKGGNYYKVMSAWFSNDEEGKEDIEHILASMKIE